MFCFKVTTSTHSVLFSELKLALVNPIGPSKAFANWTINGESGTLVPTVSLLGFRAGFSVSRLLKTSVTGPGSSLSSSSVLTVLCDHLWSNTRQPLIIIVTVELTFEYLIEYFND